MTIIISALILLILSTTQLNKLAVYTAVGNHIWFGNLISNISDRFNNIKLSNVITQLSYSKILVCIPCNTFWLSMIAGTIISTYTCTNILQHVLFQITVNFPISMIGYLNSLGNVKKQN